MLYKTVQTQLCCAETCTEQARADVVGEHAQSGADRGISMKRDEIIFSTTSQLVNLWRLHLTKPTALLTATPLSP